MPQPATTHDAGRRLWLAALGYFACYVPYAALTKALTSAEHPLSGLSLLPASAIASAVGMAVFLLATGWWRRARSVRVGGLSVHLPSRWTFLSGIASAAVIATTTLAYTFHDTSILVMVVIMKGGVLLIAPAIDAVSGRHIRPAAWIALALSVAALAVTVPGTSDLRISALAGIDIAVYLAAYVVRLRLMSHLSKSTDVDAQLRYFVEEHMTAAPMLVLLLAALAVGGVDGLRSGFALLGEPHALLPASVVGLLSEGTGIFGALILLDARENSFTVPVNRASSVLAGVIASYALVLAGRADAPDPRELAGGALVCAAIAALALGGKQPAARAAGLPTPR